MLEETEITSGILSLHAENYPFFKHGHAALMQLSQLKCLFIQLSRKRLLNGDISILILTTFVGWTSVGLDLHKNKTCTLLHMLPQSHMYQPSCDDVL